MSYLSLIKRTGGYRFQRGIPVDLRPYFPGKGTTWRENLNTKDEATARTRCLEIAARVETLFQNARKQLEADKGNLPRHGPSVELITRLVAHWKETELYRRANNIVLGDPRAFGRLLDENKITEAISEPPVSYEPELWMQNRALEDRQIRQWMSELLLQAGWSLPEQSPVANIFWNMIRDAWFDIQRIEHGWHLNDFTGMPLQAPMPFEAPPVANGQPATPPKPATAPKAHTTISEALKRWATPANAAGARSRADRTIIEAKDAVRRFIEAHGDLEIPLITRVLAREYRDLLCEIPKGLSNEHRALSIREIANADFADYEPRSAVTINKSLNLMKAIVNFVRDEGDFDEISVGHNPFDIPLVLDSFAESKYEPFTKDELNKLFSSPVFTDGLRPPQGRGDGAKWLPLFALMHGARRGEILQLVISDFRKDADTGIYEVSATTEGANTLKNVQSRRTFPLHPKMIELGFLRHLEQRRKEVGDNGSVWADFEDREKLYGRSVRWSKWFHAYLAEHVVSHKRKKFHSFRGTFKRFGNDARVPEPHLDAICGHVSSEVARQYAKATMASGGLDGGYSLTTLRDSMARLKFDGVDFSRIR